MRKGLQLGARNPSRRTSVGAPLSCVPCSLCSQPRGLPPCSLTDAAASAEKIVGAAGLLGPGLLCHFGAIVNGVGQNDESGSSLLQRLAELQRCKGCES
jgi:hypothetical protein